MSYLEKLLDGVEVEWKALGEVAELIRGNGLQKKDFTETGVPAIHYGQIYTYYGLSTIKTKSFVSPELARTLRKVNPGDIVITNTSENLEDVGKALVYLGEVPAVTGGHATVIRPSQLLLGKYFAYFTQTEEFANQKRKYAKGTKVIDVSTTDLAKFNVPIPPFSVQEEIVQILDAFTELTAKLTAELTGELTARKKQYEHYRDKLLTFNNFMGGGGGIIYKSLGDESIGRFIRGSGLQKKDFTQAGIGCIHYGQLYTHYQTWADRTKTFVSETFAKHARKAKYGDLIIATTSENDEDVCKAVAWLGEEEIAVSSDACFYTHNLNPKYVAYFFQTEEFQNQKRKFITGTKVKRVNADDLAKIEIPIPPPEEQARIVSILDQFDTLTNSISKGLPKEIALRKTQCEHNRELLMNFSKYKS